MGPSMNLDSLQAGALAGINGHNLRRPGHTSASIDPALSAHNYMLDQSMTDWTPPAVQPDTGRKIRTDARVVASFVMTLPEEIDPKDGPKVDAWIDATMDWWDSLPGKPAYAVMHMDEPKARPHIHALRIPENEAGNLNYKRDFGGHRERLDQMQESYALALEPLGVLMAHDDDRKKRRSARKETEETPARRNRRRPKTRPPETPRKELEEENKRLRQALKDSGKAKQKDYQRLKQIKDSDLPEDEKHAKMGEHALAVLTRVEKTTAEEDPAETRPATSPVTPERGVATPTPVPVQAPAPGPLFADVLRDWMQHEAAKRQAAEDRAETAEREKKKQARLARAGKAARNQHKEQAGTWKTAYHGLVEKYNGLVNKFTDLRETFIALTEQTFKYTSLIRSFRKTLNLADDDPRAEQLAERVVDDGVRVFDRQRKARAAETTPTKSREETVRDGGGREPGK